MLDIGANIKKSRELHRLTQKELAVLIGTTTQQLSRWETGGVIPGVEVLVNISEKLAIDIRDLFSGIVQHDEVPKLSPEEDQRRVFELRMLIDEMQEYHTPTEQLEWLLRIRKEREARQQ